MGISPMQVESGVEQSLPPKTHSPVCVPASPLASLSPRVLTSRPPAHREEKPEGRTTHSATTPHPPHPTHAPSTPFLCIFFSTQQHALLFRRGRPFGPRRPRRPAHCRRPHHGRRRGRRIHEGARNEVCKEERDETRLRLLPPTGDKKKNKAGRAHLVPTHALARRSPGRHGCSATPLLFALL